MSLRLRRHVPILNPWLPAGRDANGQPVGAGRYDVALTGVRIPYGTTDLGAVVAAQPAGTAFWLERGTHFTTSSIIPKNGTVITAPPGTVIDGSGTVDRAIRGNAGSGAGTGWRVANIVFDHFTASTLGAVAATTAGSVVEDCEIRNTTGASAIGGWAGGGSTWQRCFVHHNGKYGMGGNGDTFTVRNCELAYNNAAHGTNGASDAGGAKFAAGVSNLLMQANYVHHNGGGGLWVDADGYLCTWDSNLVEWNDFCGIDHEIGWDATITNNTVRYNGAYYLDPANQPGSTRSMFYGSDISVNTCTNVEVVGNTVVTIGNGIGAISASRGASTHTEGPHATGSTYTLTGLNVHANTVTVLSPGLRAGGHVGLTSALNDATNQFAANTYHTPNLTSAWWTWGTDMAKTAWQAAGAAGQDTAGTFLTP